MILEEFAFIRAILGDPEDQGPRLIYSDWLEEHGDPARAQSMRLAVALRPARKFEFLDMDLRHKEIRERLKRINAEHAERWKAALPQVQGIQWADADGGLFDEIYIDNADVFRAHAGRIFDAQPVYSFVYRWKPDRKILRTIFGAPEMERLGALYMQGHYYGPVLARAVAECAHFRDLRSLHLSYNVLHDAGARAIARSKHLRGLKELELANNPIGATAKKRLRKRFGDRVAFEFS